MVAAESYGVSQRRVVHLGEDRAVALAEDADTSILSPRQRGILTVVRDWVVQHGCRCCAAS